MNLFLSSVLLLIVCVLALWFLYTAAKVITAAIIRTIRKEKTNGQEK